MSKISSVAEIFKAYVILVICNLGIGMIGVSCSNLNLKCVAHAKLS